MFRIEHWISNQRGPVCELVFRTYRDIPNRFQAMERWNAIPIQTSGVSTAAVEELKQSALRDHHGQIRLQSGRNERRSEMHKAPHDHINRRHDLAVTSKRNRLTGWQLQPVPARCRHYTRWFNPPWPAMLYVWGNGVGCRWGGGRFLKG